MPIAALCTIFLYALAIPTIRHPDNITGGNGSTLTGGSLNTWTISSLLLLSGICLYAVINHLSVALARPYNRTHFLFACLCLAVVFLLSAQIVAYQSQSLSTFISALRWNLTFILILFMLIHWFIAEFTAIRPKPFLYGMTTLFAILLFVNFFATYTLQYSQITRLAALRLPWNEIVSVPIGQNSPAFKIGVLAVLIDFAFAIYALFLAWRRERSRSMLAMLAAIGVFFLAGIEGIAVRAATIDFIHLGWFGFLAMILVMSFTLNYETRRRMRESEWRFRSLVEQSPFSIQVLSPDGHTRQVNRSWETLWGISPDELSGHNIFEDRRLLGKGVMPFIAEGFTGNAVEIPPIEYQPDDNSVLPLAENNRWIRAYIYPIKDEENAIQDVILMHEDITERKRVEDAIRLIAAGVSSDIDEQFFEQLVMHLAKIFNADYAAITVHDKHATTRFRNLALYSKQTKQRRALLLGDSAINTIIQQGSCIYPENVQQIFPADPLLTEVGAEALIGASLHDGKELRGLLLVLLCKPLSHSQSIRQILDIFAARAVAELHRQQAEAHIRRLAYQDYLTGLANRAQLHEQLSRALQQARYHQKEGALLLIDLDHFKTINDALGHDIGDEVLRAVATRIQESCTQNVFLARLGGDEFVALVETSEPQDRIEFQQSVFMLAKRILEQLASPVFAGDRAFTIGASIGIVRFPADGETDLDILRHADMALYQAKSKGRSNVQLYLPDLEIAATNRLHLEAGLHTAISNGEMRLHFQPQVDASGDMIGAEVLLRWQHPELGEIPPETFIPVAEDTGLIHHIGEWVFDQACSRFTQWLRNGTPFKGYLSINVCPWQFARPDFVSDLREILQRYPIDTRRLMLELTETALLYDLDEAIQKLKALRVLGLRIALDDFGTGYSSLAYLRDLPLDQLKIDKNFISEVSATVEHPLVGSMIAIGKHMKLAVVAEGVETQAQFDKLIKLGCDRFQGFLFCRPVSEQSFIAWLHDNAAHVRHGAAG
jgi:diguanylate cyclase (GGDEF)-like protein